MAYANNGNAVAGAVSGAGAEAAADVLLKTLYDGKSVDELSLEKRKGLADLSSAVAVVVGGLTGNTLSDAAIGGVVGKNAVENNNFAVPAPFPLPIMIPETAAQKEANEALAVYLNQLSKEANTIHNLPLVTALYLAQYLGLLSENSDKGNNKSVPSTQPSSTQSVAGAPMPPDPDEQAKKQSKKDEKISNLDGAKQAKKLSKEQVGDLVGNKNWHQSKLKKDIANGYKKQLKSSNNFDFYINKKTGEVYIRGNQSGSEMIKIEVNKFIK